MSERIFLSLGSNRGNRVKNIENAIDHLERSVEIVRESSLYETEPYGYEDQDYFINQVIEVEYSGEPESLLNLVKDIEERMDRETSKKWGPRKIDIDILLIGDTKMRTKELVVPHPEMHKRKFVLVPLAEIAPDFRHPLREETAKTLLEKCSDRSEVKPYPG